MTSNIETLKAAIDKTGKYTPLTDAEIQAAATQRVGAIYDAREQNARQVQGASDAAYRTQLADMIARYEKSAQQSAQGYEAARGRIGEQTRSRGMQRGNYTNSLDAYMTGLQAEAAQGIAAERQRKEGDVAEDRSRLARQLDEQIAQMQTGRATDTAAYGDTLTAREYDRGVTAGKTENALMSKLYDYEHQLEIEAEEKRRWEAEMELKWAQVNAKSSGGSGGRRRSSGTKETTEPERDFGAFTDALTTAYSGLDMPLRNTTVSAYMGQRVAEQAFKNYKNTGKVYFTKK